MKVFAFLEEEAQEYGDREAIIIQTFRMWIQHNRANGSNYREGRYWTYNNLSALQKIWTWLTVSQIKHCIGKLVDRGVLLVEKHAEDQRDRTNWYAFTDEPRFLGKGQETGSFDNAGAAKKRPAQRRNQDACTGEISPMLKEQIQTTNTYTNSSPQTPRRGPEEKESFQPESKRRRRGRQGNPEQQAQPPAPAELDGGAPPAPALETPVKIAFLAAEVWADYIHHCTGLKKPVEGPGDAPEWISLISIVRYCFDLASKDETLKFCLLEEDPEEVQNRKVWQILKESERESLMAELEETPYAFKTLIKFRELLRKVKKSTTYISNITDLVVFEKNLHKIVSIIRHEKKQKGTAEPRPRYHHRFKS